MSVNEDLKVQAYKVIGSYMENADLMAKAIEQDNYILASDIAHELSCSLSQHARIWMGMAVRERES